MVLKGEPGQTASSSDGGHGLAVAAADGSSRTLGGGESGCARHCLFGLNLSIGRPNTCARSRLILRFSASAKCFSFSVSSTVCSRALRKRCELQFWALSQCFRALGSAGAEHCSSDGWGLRRATWECSAVAASGPLPLLGPWLPSHRQATPRANCVDLSGRQCDPVPRRSPRPPPLSPARC